MARPQAVSQRLPSLCPPGPGCAPTPQAAPRQPTPMGPALITAPTPSLSLPARASVKRSVSAHFESLCRALIEGRGRGGEGWGGMEGPPDPGSRSCGWTNRQSTFAASREGESEREKEARWRLASPYVLRHAAAYVRQISARPPSGAETARSREASVAAQPRRKATAPPAGRREFLQSGFPPRGKDLQ